MIKAPHRRSKHRGVDLRSYRPVVSASVPVAIPSKGREDKLCKQTLATLQRYNFDLKQVHVFVDCAARREDGSLEYDCYWKHLAKNGFECVQLHPGGDGLSHQYNRIFEFFAGVPRLLIMSDTVPQILQRRTRSWTQKELPREDFQPLIALAFDLCEEFSVRSWSLGPCKNVRNMSPGVISRKCGLLDGNCFGVNLSKLPSIHLSYSGYTTDVEFSVKAWSADGGMVRFLGITAAHKYRLSAGHEASERASSNSRQEETNASLKRLAKDYPELLRFRQDKRVAATGMRYFFRPKGPAPLKLFGSYGLRGAPTRNGKRPMSDAERQRRHRRCKASCLQRPASHATK